MSGATPDGSRSMSRPQAGRPAERQRLMAPRLFVLFLLGCLLFGYPFLGWFERPAWIAGVPTVFVYLFGAWGAFIAALAWLLESSAREPRRLPPEDEP